MNKYFVYLFVCCITASAFADQNSHAGMKVAVRQKELLLLKNELMPEIVKAVKHIDVDDYHEKHSHFDLDVTNINVNLGTITADMIDIALIDNSPDVSLTVKNVAATGTARVHAKYYFVSKTSNVDLKVSNLGCSATLKLGVDGGKLTITTQNFKINLNKDNVKVKIEGGFIDKILTEVANLLVDHFFSKIRDSLLKSVPKSIDHSLAHSLDSLPLTVEIGDDLMLNYTIPESPYVVNQYLVVSLDGFVYPKNNQTVPIKPEIDLPPMNPEIDKAIQIFISEYTLKTALEAAYQVGILKVEKESNFLWNTHTANCSVYDSPSVDLNNSVSVIAPVQCGVYLFEDWFGKKCSFLLTTEIHFDIVEIVDEAVLYFKINKFKLRDLFIHLTFLEPLFSQDIRFHMFKAIGDWFFSEMVKAVNTHLFKEGVPLPTIDNTDYTDTDEIPKVNYLEIDSTPKFNFTSIDTDTDTDDDNDEIEILDTDDE